MPLLGLRTVLYSKQLIHYGMLLLIYNPEWDTVQKWHLSSNIEFTFWVLVSKVSLSVNINWSTRTTLQMVAYISFLCYILRLQVKCDNQNIGS